MKDVAVSQVAGLAQREYYKRPADQRYQSIDTLEAAVLNRRNRSVAFDLAPSAFEFSHTDKDGVIVLARKVDGPAKPTHYSFGQTAGLVKFNAESLRLLGEGGRHDLVAANLNAALQIRKDKLDKDVKVMLVEAEDGESAPTLQAVTSPTYGRIWDADVVAATRKILDANPQFDNPKEWGGQKGGLYASDRDIFLLYVDGGSIVDGGADQLNGGDRDQLHRGFMVWNSEVGSATFGIAAFLFRYVCGNHMIHGIEGTKLVKIRHTSGGPERFVNEAIPALKEYVNASAQPIESAVKASKAYALPTDEAKFTDFFIKKGFTKAEVKKAKAFAEIEEGGAGSLWQMQQGFTRAARDLAFMDARTELERRAGKLLDLAAEKVAA